MRELLRVLIADDEKIAREGLRDLVNWSELGMEVVYCATNGEEALTYLLAHPVDILLTDIKMPRIDGLELLQELSERGVSPTTIIFSGFSDFHYAQRAIRYGVLNYLLKPIRMGELTETLRRAADSLRQERGPEPLDAEEYARFRTECSAEAEELTRELARQICRGDSGAVQKLCGEIQAFFQQRGYSAAVFRKFAFQCVYTLVGEVNQFTGAETALLEDTDRLALLSVARTIQDASALLTACADDLCAYVYELRRSGKRRIIGDVLTILQHRYADENLSLNTLADQLGVTPNYLSALFRREMGQTFSTYLENFRIERAKELLRDVRHKVYEVASAVGYGDARHFGKVFKAHTGRTPLEFRNMVPEHEG